MSDPLLDDPEKPITPPARRYKYQTGTEFFTPENESLWGDFTSEYTAGGDAYDTLAGTYASSPVVYGYEEETEAGSGEYGAFTPTQSLYNQATLMSELQNLPTPQSFQDWLTSRTAAGEGAEYTDDITTSSAWANINTLLADMSDLTDEFIAADERSALSIGFYEVDAEGNPILDENGGYVPDLEAYYAWKRENQTPGGIMENTTGVMGTEYEEAFRRNTQVEINQMIDANMRMIEALGNQNTASAYMKMGEISNQISAFQVKNDMILLEQDMLFRETEFEALNARYESMTDTASAEAGMYMESVFQNRMAALSAYAVQIDAIFQQNEQILAEYGADINAMVAHADITYQKLMGDIGYSDHLMSMASESYEAYMAPYYDQMAEYYQDMTIYLTTLETEGDGGPLDDLFGNDPNAIPSDVTSRNLETVGGATAGGFAFGSSVAGLPGCIVGGIIGFVIGLFGTVASGDAVDSSEGGGSLLEDTVNSDDGQWFPWWDRS